MKSKNEPLYPDILPKGTIIRIGKGWDIKKSAIGIEFELNEDVHRNLGTKAYYTKSFQCKIIKNPNNWEHRTVTHSINLLVDSIVSGLPNKVHAHILERLDDE